MNKIVSRQCVAVVALSVVAIAGAAQTGQAQSLPADASGQNALATTTATSKTLPGTQEAQINSYYCGPAALRGAIRMRGITSGSQSTLAAKLGTTTNGTAWGSHNMEKVFNQYLGYTFYVPAYVSYTATATEKANYKRNLVNDITSNYPLIGAAKEVSGGPHLIGHPSNRNIDHWYTIRGYANSGETTYYQDSVHGASSISWSGSVPAYSAMSSDTITRINGGFGYIW